MNDKPGHFCLAVYLYWGLIPKGIPHIVPCQLLCAPIVNEIFYVFFTFAFACFYTCFSCACDRFCDRFISGCVWWLCLFPVVIPVVEHCWVPKAWVLPPEVQLGIQDSLQWGGLH